jgi:hypothetical protein
VAVEQEEKASAGEPSAVTSLETTEPVPAEPAETA